MMVRRPKEPREEGSLLLVLLAAIILAGVLVALFTTVFTGTQSARFDRNFSQAFQIADAGVQQAFVQLLELDPDNIDLNGEAPCQGPDDDDAPGEASAHPDYPADTANSLRGTCTMTLDDGSTFTWVYEQTEAERRQWNVLSQGSFNGVDRAVQVVIGQGPLFSGALMSEDSTFWSGGGSSTENCPTEGTFPVSVEGPALLDPSGDCISQLTLYGVDRVITSDDRIDTYLAGEDPVTEEPKEVVFPGVPLDLPDIGGQAFEPDGVCGGSVTVETDMPNNNEFERGVVYCLTDFVAGNGSYTVRPSLPDTVSPANRDPAIVYVQNSVKFNSGTEVNIDQMAVDLQIYSAGDEVRIQSTANARAAVWAPKAYCHSTGGSGEFWGALSCFNIHLSGNWNYDPSVSVITSPTFRISNYTEEVPNQS